MLVAHFSDIHLLSIEGVRPGDLLNKRVTGAVNLLLNRGGQFPVENAEALVADLQAIRPDHVILSGDLTNLAFPAELRLVRGLLERLPVPPSQVTVVPGNHDYYTRRSVDEDHFGRILQPFLRGDRQPGPGTFPLLRLQGELAVVALSTAIPSPPLMAVGRLGDIQLRSAGELLTSEEARGRFRLVVLHHPPRHAQVRWHNSLIDHLELEALLERTGADLVVHGHMHCFTRVELPGRRRIPLIGVGSGTWRSLADPERRAQYNLYEIEGGRLVGVRRRRLDPVRGAFEEMDTEPNR